MRNSTIQGHAEEQKLKEDTETGQPRDMTVRQKRWCHGSQEIISGRLSGQNCLVLSEMQELTSKHKKGLNPTH